MSATPRHPDLPKPCPPRPLSIVLAAIAANVADQQRVLDDPTIADKRAALAKLQEDQQALYREKRRAEFVRAGIVQTTIGSAE